MDLIKDPPSKEQFLDIGKKFPNGLKDLLNPIKKEDPYYIAHIAGREDQLSDEEYADLFNRFPDLLKKPITTNGSEVVVGFNKDKLEALFK